MAGLLLLIGPLVTSCSSSPFSTSLLPGGDGYSYGAGAGWTYHGSVQYVGVNVHVVASSASKVWARITRQGSIDHWVLVWDGGSVGSTGLTAPYPSVTDGGQFGILFRTQGGAATVQYSVNAMDLDANWPTGALSPGNRAGPDCSPSLFYPGSDLSGMDLSGKYLLHCDMTGVNLSGANLSNTYLAGAVMINANVTGANFFKAEFALTIGVNTVTGIDTASLSYTKWSDTPLDLSNKDYSGKSLLVGAFFNGVDVTNTNFTNADLSYVIFYQAVGINTTIGLLTANVGGTSFSYSGLDWSGADLTGKNLHGTGFGNANLTGANVTNADLSYAGLDGVSGLQTIIGLSTAQLDNARLGAVDFHGLDLHGKNLRGVWLLAGGNFSGANLSGASLIDVNFQGVDLSGANLSGANLQGAQFWSNVNFAGATTTGWTGNPWSHWSAICPDGTLASSHGDTCIGYGF